MTGTVEAIKLNFVLVLTFKDLNSSCYLVCN